LCIKPVSSVLEGSVPLIRPTNLISEPAVIIWFPHRRRRSSDNISLSLPSTTSPQVWCHFTIFSLDTWRVSTLPIDDENGSDDNNGGRGRFISASSFHLPKQAGTALFIFQIFSFSIACIAVLLMQKLELHAVEFRSPSRCCSLNFDTMGVLQLRRNSSSIMYRGFGNSLWPRRHQGKLATAFSEPESVSAGFQPLS
jgi:hypothetical protein